MHSKFGSDFSWFPLFLALFGIAFLFLVTPHGLGLFPDSVAYIQSSKTLLEHGSLEKLAFWPPGYPSLIAVFAIFQHDYLFAARLLGVILFGLNLFLFSSILIKCGWSNLFAGLLTTTLLFDHDFLYLHMAALSEPLFLTTLLGGMLALLNYDNTKSKKWLIALGLIFGMAAIVRYAGVAFILGVALALFLQCMRQKNSERFLQRVLPTIQFLAIAVFPIFIWVVKKSLDSGKIGLRESIFHPVNALKWHEGLDTFASWFGGIGAAGFLLTLAAIFLIVGRKNMSTGAKRFVMFSGCIIFTYLIFIFLTLLYFDAAILLDFRILSPVKLLIYMSIIVSMQAIPPKWRLLEVGVFCALVLTLNYSAAREVISNSSLHGFAFAQVELKNMPILAFIRENHIELDATNSPELASLYLNQEVPMLPASYTWITGLPLADQPAKLRELSRPRNTVVIFSALLWRDYLPKQQQLMDMGFTNIVYQQPDGIILQHP